jgi:hypothetical protein
MQPISECLTLYFWGIFLFSLAHFLKYDSVAYPVYENVTLRSDPILGIRLLGETPVNGNLTRQYGPSLVILTYLRSHHV